jgi:sugar phosphate isomerase/epimerase
MTRKDFLKTATGAVAATAISGAAAAAAEKPGPKRGVCIYSYSDDIYKTMTLEDCLAAAGDLGGEGQEIGLDILANSHIEGYPNPTDAWVKKWHDMCAKYHVKPVEYGHWVDSKLYSEKQPWLDTRQSYEMLVRDIKLANRLGFTCGRTKLGVMDGQLTPVPNWREFIKMALPVAQKYNFRMMPEIHSPSRLKSKMVDDYVDFIEKERTTPWFGLNIDFGVFQNRRGGGRAQGGPPAGMAGRAPAEATAGRGGQGGRSGAPGGMGGGMGGGGAAAGPSTVGEMIPLLPYVHCCHAKFMEMNDNFEEPTIPYPEILKMLVDHKWNGYLVSEYEGEDRASGGTIRAVRKHHVMMRRLLGEA